MSADPYLTSYLRDQDVACPSCQSNLRGLNKNACPECGLKLQIGLLSHHRGIGAFLAIIIAISTALGFNLFWFAGLVLLSFFEGYFEWELAWPSVPGSVVFGMGLVRTLFRRRRIVGYTRETQWWFFAGWLLLSVVSVLVFFYIIF